MGPQALEGSALITITSRLAAARFLSGHSQRDLSECGRDKRLAVAEFAKNFALGKENLRFRKSWRLPQRLTLRHATSPGFTLVLLLLLRPSLLLAQTAAPAAEHLVVVLGAVGSDEYKTEFSQWAQPWIELSAREKWQLTLIGEQPSQPKITVTKHDASVSSSTCECGDVSTDRNERTVSTALPMRSSPSNHERKFAVRPDVAPLRYPGYGR